MVEIRGGDKFAAVLREIADQLGDGGQLRVGFLEGAIAAIQDGGAPGRGIPPRPFFRNMIAAKSPEWPAAIGAELVANNYDVEKTLERSGHAISGQLRQSIVDTNSPALAPSTIARKGHSKPLVDSAHMLNSVDYEVKT